MKKLGLLAVSESALAWTVTETVLPPAASAGASVLIARFTDARTGSAATRRKGRIRGNIFATSRLKLRADKESIRSVNFAPGNFTSHVRPGLLGMTLCHPKPVRIGTASDALLQVYTLAFDSYYAQHGIAKMDICRQKYSI